jgi:rubrerythrin
MGRLYRVTVEVEVICYAADEEDAEDVARESLRNADGELEHADVHAMAVSSLTKEEQQCLPWGGDGVRTCAEYLAEEP